MNYLAMAIEMLAIATVLNAQPFLASAAIHINYEGMLFHH
jgi:hypothetical protein